MAFIYNGRIPENITYNGFNVSKIIYNNELVWAKKRLPDEYQEVEYIEAIDGQYINTNYIPTATNKVVCEYSVNSWTSATTYQGIFGTRNSSGTSNDCFGYTFSSSTLYICYGKQVAKSFSNELNHKYKVELSIDNFKLDGESLVTSFSGTTDFELPLLIFARNRNDGAGSFLNGRIYSFKLYDNNVLIRNFIPCYRISDNEIGLYDVVNDVFYTNDGTGTFDKGNDVIVNRLPNQYEELDYLETDGTKYIDTGVVYTHNTRTKIKFRTSNNIPTTASTCLFSSGGSSTVNVGFALGSSAVSGKYRVFYRNNYNSPTALDLLTDYVMDFNKEKFYLDNTLVYTFPATTFTAPFTMPLFAQYWNTKTPINYAKSGTRIYYAKIYEDNALIRNFIPCERKLDNVQGLYDLVNNQFYELT